MRSRSAVACGTRTPAAGRAAPSTRSTPPTGSRSSPHALTVDELAEQAPVEALRTADPDNRRALRTARLRLRQVRANRPDHSISSGYATCRVCGPRAWCNSLSGCATRPRSNGDRWAAAYRSSVSRCHRPRRTRDSPVGRARDRQWAGRRRSPLGSVRGRRLGVDPLVVVFNLCSAAAGECGA